MLWSVSILGITTSAATKRSSIYSRPTLLKGIPNILYALGRRCNVQLYSGDVNTMWL